MKKLVFALALAAFCAVAVRADDYLRVVKTIPASSNAVVSVSFGVQPVTPVAFRVLGEAAGTNTVSASIVDVAAGYRIEQPLVASQSTTSTNTAITATGYTGVVYPGSRIELRFVNAYARPGAVVIYAKK